MFSFHTQNLYYTKKNVYIVDITTFQFKNDY